MRKILLVLSFIAAIMVIVAVAAVLFALAVLAAPFLLIRANYRPVKRAFVEFADEMDRRAYVRLLPPNPADPSLY